MIYKLRHPDPSKAGFTAGVDFSGGIGTTSSLEDANRLRVMAGCELTMIVDGVEKPVEIVEERHKVRYPNTKQELEVGPVILRAVVIEAKKDEGGAAAPPVVSPPAKGKPGRKAKVKR